MTVLLHFNGTRGNGWLNALRLRRIARVLSTDPFSPKQERAKLAARLARIGVTDICVMGSWVSTKTLAKRGWVL